MSQRFEILQPEQYARQPPRVTEPREITSYSVDVNRIHYYDAANRDCELKYFVSPDLHRHSDLSYGFPELFVQRADAASGCVEGFLNALEHAWTQRQQQQQCEQQQHEQQQREQQPGVSSSLASIGPKNVDLIVFRGVMTSILCMPYMRQDEWHLSATKVGNTIVIENRPTAAKLRDNDPSKQTFRQRLATYWGHRFETITTMPVPAYEINSPGIDGNCVDYRQMMAARHREITNTNAEYCSVFHTQLGSHGIVMAAEVDCATSRKVTDPADSTSRHPNRLYLELKTSKQPGNPTEVQFFERNKLLKFWAQSFLAGIPTVIVGWRTHSGRGSNRCSVTGIQRFETRDIPRMVRGKPWMWDPNVCLNFADEFIAFMKQCLEQAEEGQCFVFSHGPADDFITVSDQEHSMPTFVTPGLAALLRI